MFITRPLVYPASRAAPAPARLRPATLNHELTFTFDPVFGFGVPKPARIERRHPSGGCQDSANRLHCSPRPTHRLGGMCLRLGVHGVHCVARAHGREEELSLKQPKSQAVGLDILARLIKNRKNPIISLE